MPRITRSKILPLTFVATALLAPVAHAAPIDPIAVSTGVPATFNETLAYHSSGLGSGVQGGGGSRPLDTLRAPAASPAASGFEWGDAAIGAAAMLTAVCLGAGTVSVVQRSRRPGPPVSA